jgi:peptide/nickel transport system substrate-binding protein
MRTFLQTLVLSLGLALCLPSGAKHFRWASQGDAASLDPHAQNEGVTNQVNNMVYERLLDYDKKMKLVPMLATSWENPEPNRWVFKLRRDVKFHDGTPFTADDVVFSFDRAKYTTASFKLYALEVGAARKVDDYTVEFVTTAPNPVEPSMVSNIFIMSKAWCEKNKSARPQDITHREETFSALNSNGTGPFILVAREPGVKTTHRRNPDWWGTRLGMFEGNVDTVEYRPVANGATRNAALRSGELDFVLDPPVQDIASLKEDRAIKVWEGQETRVIFVGMDQARDELLYSTVKGKNPFKDVRVRRALYQAIDTQALKTQVMRGLSIPTGIPLPDPVGSGLPASMEKRPPYDPAAVEAPPRRGGISVGFRLHHHLPQQPLHQRREDLHGARGDVGAGGPRCEGGSDPARAILPQGAEARRERVHLGLGERRAGCDLHVEAGAAQPRQGEGAGHQQRRRLQECRARWPHRRRRERDGHGEAPADDQPRRGPRAGPGAGDAAPSPGDPMGFARGRDRRASSQQPAQLHLGESALVR